jgi:dTDP-L-rhamnose 4-epimerase
VQGCVLSLEKSSANNEVFNVGSEEVVSVTEMAQTLSKIYNSKLKPEVNNKFRIGDIRHCYPDISKLKSKLSFSPKVKLEKGMRDLVSWSEDQEAKDSVIDALKELNSKKFKVS